MKIRVLPDSQSRTCVQWFPEATSLRKWLAGRWAILFSHPEDFAQEEMEMDRWISVLGRSFAACGVVPIALARAGYDAESGWLAALDRESTAVLALPPAAFPAEPSTSALRADIVRSGPRLAMIIDRDARSRRTLSYRVPAALPSPLDLIGWAASLRKRAAARAPSFPCDRGTAPARTAFR
jgi:hypothetical protein